MILGFGGEYRWLSNFYKVDIKYGGLVFPSTENAYQAMKSTSKNHAIKCTLCEPGVAKRLGKKCQDSDNFRSNFHNIKLDLMYKLNLQKYFENDDLALFLAHTGDKKIVETNLWHDNFWGDCICPKCNSFNGKNHLGKIIMKIRHLITGAKIWEGR